MHNAHMKREVAPLVTKDLPVSGWVTRHGWIWSFLLFLACRPCSLWNIPVHRVCQELYWRGAWRT